VVYLGLKRAAQTVCPGSQDRKWIGAPAPADYNSACTTAPATYPVLEDSHGSRSRLGPDGA